MPANVARHKYVSAATQGADASKVRKNDWNDDHVPTFSLDNRVLHASYGDDFAATSLDGKWTRRVFMNPSETFGDSWIVFEPHEGFSAGILEPWTPTTEADFIIKGAFLQMADEGSGIACLNSSGTGIWFGFRTNGAGIGLYPVTTYTVGTAPTTPYYAFDSRYNLGSGRPVWMKLIKKSGMYQFAFSFDGARWSHPLSPVTPTAFTPSQIGFLTGVQDAYPSLRELRLDYFDVENEKSLGNNLIITPTSGTPTYTVSGTAFSGAASNVADGNTGGTPWVVQPGATPIWWNCAWSVAQSINRLRLYTYDHDWGSGYVELSSGTKIPFYANNGDRHNVFLDFPTESTTFVKVWCHQAGIGSFAGLYEVEAYLAS